MAKVFTTSFIYNGESYMAVVSQLDGAVKIYVPDESLHDIIPNGKATFLVDQGLKKDPTQTGQAYQILLEILSGIDQPSQEIPKIS